MCIRDRFNNVRSDKLAPESSRCDYKRVRSVSYTHLNNKREKIIVRFTNLKNNNNFKIVEQCNKIILQ